MVTLACPMNPAGLKDPDTAKVIVNGQDYALYFSRYPIPYSRHEHSQSPKGCLKHIGIYGYKKSFLRKFCQTPPPEMERAEGLEPLRALYLGARLKVLRVKELGPSVDRPVDVQKAQRCIQEKYGLT